jgi:UDP-N-acetylmuramate: L-alanyl-gamma-D-glutamyl-meso-diaminopimelate ligase
LLPAAPAAPTPAPSADLPPPCLIVPSWEARARSAAASTQAPIWLTALSDQASTSPAPHAQIRAENLAYAADRTTFDLHLPNAAPTTVDLPLPGRHNVMNALIAAGLAFAAGATPDAIATGLHTFALPLKRLTVRGEVDGTIVYDDFAHHPTAIEATLSALRQRHPDRRLVALFEAQSNTARRKVFQDGFATALAHADRVWFCKPLDKASDPLPPDQRIDLNAVRQHLEARGTPATIIEDIPSLAAAVITDTRPGDVLAVLSGRDFGNIHDQLLKGLRDRQEQ